MDEMKDPITLDFTATQAPAEDAPVGQKALDSERPPVRVVLLALDQGKFDSQRSLDELAALAEANGMQAVATVCQKRSTPEAATLLGEGKVEEARLVCLNTDAEAAIFDGELTGSQIRNISTALGGLEVIDRTMLILEIFRSRAVTNEGKLQTELALLRYRLPRLQGMGEALSRQGGGGGGGGGARRGAGETKLELDRRHVHARIDALAEKLGKPGKPWVGLGESIPGRPPVLCAGCPHRGVFYTLSKNKCMVYGDIGCYTLGFAPPLNCMDVCICMGGGFSAGMGMAKSFQREGVTDKVVFGVMGDSTFFHSGMTGAAEIIYNNGRMIPCVLDNRITGMTGHQDNPGSGFTLMGEPAPMISVEKVLEAYGFAPVFTVDPQDLTAMKKTVDNAVAALNEGKHPAIVTRRPCLLIKRVKHDTGMCVVNADKCKSCKSCLKVGCPAISMENGKAFIDRTQCVGCTVCAQACPFGAIEKEEK